MMMREEQPEEYSQEALEEMSMMKRYLIFIFNSAKRCFGLYKFFLYYFGFKLIVLYGIKNINNFKFILFFILK